MTVTLTPEQQQALDAQPHEPLQIVDPRTKASFVLLRAEEFERIRDVWEDERFLKAASEIAMRNAAKRMLEDDLGS